jgi:serine/threonine protein kinase
MLTTTTDQTEAASLKLDAKSKKIGKYVLIGTLGKGKYKVKKALDVSANHSRIVALKLFRKTDWDHKHNYEQEKTAYSRFDHKNTLKMVDSFEDFYYLGQDGSCKRFNVLVLEYAAKGDLFSYIEKTKAFEDHMTRYLFLQIMDGLQHIHENGYAHLDIKLENIYFDQDYVVKLADFDLSRPMNTKDFNPRRVGSVNYMAPEIQEDKGFNGAKVDIFALGVLLFTLASSKLPFISAKGNDSWFKHIKNGDYDLFWELHERRGITLPANLKNLLNSMFAYDPQRRPSLMAIRTHPWVKGSLPSDTEYLEEMDRRHSRVIN